MSDRDERIFLLALQELFFQAPTIARGLLAEAGSARCIFQEPRRRLRERFGNRRALFDRFSHFDRWDEMQRRCRAVDAMGAQIIALGDEAYPPLLAEIVDPPPVLVVRGALRDALSGPCVAIVGSRRATRHGCNVTAQIAGELAEAGVIVVSGMAYGIDAAAHRGALAGMGQTVAVFGCGPDILYPASNRDLAHEILQAGLLLSEFPLGREPERSFFPQRNRIISGLAIATIVIEAAERSGSLITARLALEQGREVGAVPGQGGTAAARGVNSLLRDGAALVECGRDVRELIASPLLRYRFSKSPGQCQVDVGKHCPILNALGKRKGRTIDEIIVRTDLEASEVMATLSRLVIEGDVEELSGRRYRLNGD